MYNWLKDIAQWRIGKTLYLSVVFSWDIGRAVQIAKAHKGKVVVGGPAAIYNRELFDNTIEVQSVCQEAEPILFHNPLATFTSRGCPGQCEPCIVPKIEGNIREIKSFRTAPVVCDNNFLATSRKHQERVVDSLTGFDLVDFNQGLDAGRFNRSAARMLSRLRLRARFAFDHISLESKVADAVSLCRKLTTKNIGVYVLIGYDDTPEDALYRLELVRSWGIRPNPMRYQPLDAEQKNSHVADGWTEKGLRKMVKYYSRLRWYEHIPYEDFDYTINRDSAQSLLW